MPGGGVAGVAHSITGHEQIYLNRVCYFHFFGVFIVLKEFICFECHL